ncbi:MAG: hypothetical protein OXJ90_28950 [Spirochaetaceae bacterium]|nr:hypothetical protein [Spirochaetaceae bacterium]
MRGLTDAARLGRLMEGIGRGCRGSGRRAQDLRDVAAMRDRRLIEPATLRRLFDAIEGALVRYPALDPDSFRGKVERAISEWNG